MKNFRKVLALVLVVATLFSFAAMAGAKTYTDAEDISYVEAVTVLSQVGVLNGYEDDSFKPTSTISREEMAKMIAVLANAGSDVSKLYASANAFADVENDRWSASYVAYCAQTGIVAGRTADTFDPYGKVTGLETAKMLLVVLGFDAQEQGYVGANWKINVLRDAKVMGLLNNFAAAYDVEAAITREEAAQMMLNALEAPCVVGVLSDSIITVTNALVFDAKTMSAPALVKVETFAKLKDALKAGKWALYGNVVISDDLLCEKLFDLYRTTDTTTDCYGRPATSWTYTTIAGAKKTFGIPYAESAIFTSVNTTAAKVEAALAAYEGVEAVLYVDGVKKDSAVKADTIAEICAMITFGKGVQVEVYYANGILTFVVINTRIAKIGQVNTAYHTVDLDTWTNGVVTKKNYVNEFGLTPADEGKVALVWMCKDSWTAEYELHDLQIIEPTVATITDATTVGGDITKSSFNADGKSYEYSANAYRYGTTDVVGDAAYLIGKKADIYTDLNGFVMAVEEHDDTEILYAVIDDASVEKVLVKEVQGEKKYSYTASLIKFEENPAPGEAVAATKSAYDVDYKSPYDTLIKYELVDGKVTVVDKTGALAADNAVLSKFASKCVGLPGTITEDTQILLRVYDYMAGKHVYKYFDGKSAIDATYNLQHAQNFVNDGFITYMYAEAATVETSVNAFILGYTNSKIYLTGEDQDAPVGYDVYEALVNGEPALIAYNGPVNGADFAIYEATAKFIGKQTIDGEPIYLVPTLVNATATGSFIVKGDTIKWSGTVKDLAANCKIIVAFPEKWDNDNDGDTDEITYTTVTSNAALNDFIEAQGWTNGDAWAFDTDGDGYTDVLYVLNVEGTDPY